jgi:hypothetical protein
VTRPLDRSARLPAIGLIDEEAGEFWVENPFDMPAQGMNLSAYERDRLFLSTGGGRFVDGSFPSGTDSDADSRSVVAADFDRDGAPDLLVASVGGGPLRLYLNRFPEVRRVRLELSSGESGAAAVGARVVAEVGDRRLVRDLFQVNGGAGQGPAELYLGLGTAPRIDRLSVRWPSGREQVFTDLPADRALALVEGRDTVAVAPLASARSGSGTVPGDTQTALERPAPAAGPRTP